MPEFVEITDVRLREMDADKMTPMMAQSGVSWYVLTLTLQNKSDEPIHLMSDIRRIRYEAGRQVLVVQLSEHEAPSKSSVVGLPMPPRYRMVGACEVAIIVHPLSSPITFLEISADGAWRPNYVRLAEDVDSIECTVAYETAPPSAAVNLAAKEVSSQWRGRGTTVAGVWTAPARSSPTKPSASQE